MIIRPLGLAALAAGITLCLGSVAFAGKALPPDQKAQVEQMLKKEGFTEWDEIELDDGMIEVDDAVDASGKTFDLKLDPQTLEIKKRKAE